MGKIKSGVPTSLGSVSFTLWLQPSSGHMSGGPAISGLSEVLVPVARDVQEPGPGDSVIGKPK